MEIAVVETEQELGAVAAGRIAQLVGGRPDPVLGVATGSSPLGTYAALAGATSPTVSPSAIR